MIALCVLFILPIELKYFKEVLVRNGELPKPAWELEGH
jgi:Tfp pilus assembly major pilin PilA